MQTPRKRRQILQQSYYKAALPFLSKPPAWGALSGVRPTKLTTRCLKGGLNDQETLRHMERVYFVTPRRAKLALDCSHATMEAAAKLNLQLGYDALAAQCEGVCARIRKTRVTGGHLKQVAAMLLLGDLHDEECTALLTDFFAKHQINSLP